MKKPLPKYDYNQSPFYKLNTKKKLSSILQVALEDLESLQGLSSCYKRVWLHKTKKTWLNVEPNQEQADLYRPIDLPPENLKAVQKRIEILMSRVSVADNVYSPVKGRSYVNNAAAHRAAAAVYSMDIENYFPNTSRSKIVGFFKNTFSCPEDVAVIITNIVTKNDGLPQGSPCSPILAYHVNREMWDEISAEVFAANCISTIYADDLTISGDVVRGTLVFSIRKIVRKHGLSIKKSKNKSSYKRPSKITGVIVSNGELLLPNGQHKKIKEAAIELANARSDIEAKLAGNRLRSRRSQRDQIKKENSN